jgi:hypothetical protein
MLLLFFLLLLSFPVTLRCYNRHPPSIKDFREISESGNYTCDEIIRWLGTEKHYSNDKKNILFGFLALTKQKCENQPYMLLEHVSYGNIKGKRTFFLNSPSSNNNQKQLVHASSQQQCKLHDDYAVAFLSNFSINNNFSHFLHALLRLFCSLIDAKIFVWNHEKQNFIKSFNYTIWLDENLKVTPEKQIWLESFGGKLKLLSEIGKKDGDCVSSRSLIYGSGCIRLLPPEKWFGYPGCRAGDILPAFGEYMRQYYKASNSDSLKFIDSFDEDKDNSADFAGLRVAFAVRDTSEQTGKRQISNLEQVQSLLKRTQHVKSSMENITFEHLDVPSTIRYMSNVHIFVSVHGAGMTNMFFMNPGSAVVEIIPFPLCSCKSPDYFYGVGGYYHGSSVAQGIKHYHYCVPASEVKWHKIPDDLRTKSTGGKCSWRHLHAVDSIFVDPSRFVSLMRNVERDLVIAGTIVLTKPIINISPHANG